MTRDLIPHQHITVFSDPQLLRVESARIELAARRCIRSLVDTIETPHQVPIARWCDDGKAQVAMRRHSCIGLLR